MSSIPPEDAARLVEVERLLESLQDKTWQAGYEAALDEHGDTNAVEIFELGRRCGARDKVDQWWEGYTTGANDAAKPCTLRHVRRPVRVRGRRPRTFGGAR